MLLVEKLTKNFGKKIVFQNLSFSFPENKLIFVVGKSGSGKTTLLNLLSGIDENFEGEINYFVDEQNYRKTIRLREKNLIGYVFQEFNLIQNLKAQDNILLARNILGFDLEIKKLIKTADFLNFDVRKLNLKTRKLSAGESQKIAILRSVLSDKKIIFADEPTANVDKKSSDSIFELLKKISQEKTVVVVSHDLKSAEKYADFIYFIEKNKLLKNKGKFSLKQKFCQLKNQNSKYLLKNKIKPIKKIVISDFKENFVNFFLIFLFFFVSIMLIGNFINLSRVENKNLKGEIWKTNSDLIQISKYNKSYINFSLTSSEIKEIQNVKNNKYSLKNYPLKGKKFYFLYQDKNIEINKKNFIQIDNSDFFKNRIKLGDGQKINLQKDNQIVLGKNVVDFLEIKNPVGAKIKLCILVSSEKYYFDLEVSGINYEKNYDHDYNFYIKNDLVKKIELETSQKNQKKYLIQQQVESPEKNRALKIVNFFVSDIKTDFDKLNIFQGRLPQNYNEVVIPDFFVQNSEINYLKSDWLIENYYFNKFPIKIVGIYKTERKEKDQEILYSTEEGKKIYQSPAPDFINVYSSDVNSDFNFFKKRGFDVNFWANSQVVNVIKSYKKFLSIFVYVVIGVVILTLISLATIFRLLVNSKRKEMAIFKTLGASKVQCFFYYFFSFFILQTFIFLIIFAFSFPLENFIQFIVTRNSNIEFGSFWHQISKYIYIWICFFIFSFFVYFTFSVNFFRKNIIKIYKI